MKILFSKPFLFCGILFMLAGCYTPAHMYQDDAVKIKKVAVVSVLSQHFYRTYVGLTAFGNERERQSIPELNVDEQYESSVVNAINKHGAIKAIRIADDRGTLLDLGEKTSATVLSGVFLDLASAETQLRALARKHEIDAFVILSPAILTQYFGNQSAAGIGHFASGAGSSTYTGELHVIGALSIVDKNAKRIATRRLSTTSDPFPPLEIPRVLVPADQGRLELGRLSLAQKLEIRESLKRLPENYWEQTVAGLLNFAPRPPRQLTW